MASAQLPPRQKMINMLYLVLTAMLALNVSKEVLDAFAIMDAELVRSERAHGMRSQLDYALFADAAERFPDKFSDKYDHALRVKAQADALVEHIEALKTAAVASADNIDPAMLRGPDATGRDTLRTLLAVNAKDDRSTFTRMLIGSDPGTPHRNPGGAHDLKQRVAAFRDSLKTLSGTRANDGPQALDLLFDLGERRDASGVRTSWEAANFYDIPLVAGVATLSKLQADVRSAENDMVKWLYRSVEEADYKFGTLTPAVIPQSNMVMLGDSFRADVFLAAYDPRNPPQVMLDGSGALPIGNDGKAKLRLQGDRIGEQVGEGMIRFEGPAGVEEIPYSIRYQVMAPLLVASPTKMNVLFRGVENPVEIAVPGVPSDRIQVITSNGRITRQAQGWVAHDLAPGMARISAVVTMPDGRTRQVGPAEFRVKDLPPPMAYVAGKGSRDNTVRKGDLTAALGVVASLEDALFDAPFRVTRFRLTHYRKDGTMSTHTCTGNRFTKEISDQIATIRPRERIILEEIHAKLTNDQGPEVALPSISLLVIP